MMVIIIEEWSVIMNTSVSSRLRYSLLCTAIGLSLFALSACSNPLTSPENGVMGCVDFMQELTFSDYFAGDDAPPERATELRQLFSAPMDRFYKNDSAGNDSQELNILVRSGGGQWGAYGAGFLNGWSEIENLSGTDALFMGRGEIDMITGISTGALQSTLAFAGINANERKRADDALEFYYTPEEDDAVIKLGSEFWALIKGRNAIGDPAPLEASIDQMITDFAPTVQSGISENKQLYVGLANARHGDLHLADMRDTLREGRSDCYKEFLLGSSAVPFGFPPRFIDGEMYVDGGVRQGAFLPVFWDNLARQMQENDIDMARVKVNVLTIINGNLSANRQPECALFGNCPPVKNSLLGVAKRSVDIIEDSVYNFSVYAIHEIAKERGFKAEVKIAYIPPAVLRAASCTPLGSFNPEFMQCLYDAGLADGKNQVFRSPFRDGF